MVTMWLPSPAALLADVSAAAAVLHPRVDYAQQYLLTSPLSDLTPPSSLYAPAAHGSPSPPKPLPPAFPKLSPARPPPKKCFRCPYPGCSQTSSNKGNLSKHIATRHEHRKDFACPFKGCTRRFAKKYNMLRHLSASGVHRSAKPSPPRGPKKPKATRRPSDRAKWSSMELDLARFLAKQCQQNAVVSAM